MLISRTFRGGLQTGMNIADFYQLENSRLSFSRQQASDFAKQVAGDFNPIHDIDSKRFCVPGDLLFSVMIHHYGLSEKMVFRFSGMVNEKHRLVLPEADTGEPLKILDEGEKQFLEIERSGATSDRKPLIESLTTHYVAFSGKAFPTILQPLMQQNNVMVNPDRPLVIYESMSFELEHLDADEISLELSAQELNCEGKRGDVTLRYRLLSNGEQIGEGCKRMVLSGLREYDAVRMDELVVEYNERKSQYPGVA